MTLRFCTDLSPAAWISGSDLPWDRLVTFGPAGFDRYARLRILPDPTHPGQSENDADEEDWRYGQLSRLFALLATRTATPDDCFFCVWDGFGTNVNVSGTGRLDDEAVYIDDEATAARLGQPGARPGWAPAPLRPQSPTGPKVVVPHRAYWLFRGPLAELGGWDTAAGWPGDWRLGDAEPAFVWPSDSAWCVTRDVDPHWAGIGGDAPLIDRLVAEPHLDVVPADPGQPQPAYR